MGDQFEKFMRENKDSFQQEIDGTELWNRIDGKLSSKKKFDFQVIWKIAAVLFLFSTVALLFEKKTESSLAETSQLNEFLMVEEYYSQVISEKKEFLRGEASNNLSREFLDDIEKLDSSYSDLKKTFGEKVTNEKILNAMIQNLQLQLNILNQQVQIIEESKTTQNEKDEYSI